jgi:hypothetical protein
MRVEVKNEFAHVVVELDQSGHSPRLRVTDVYAGKAILLDPMELEALAWASHDDLATLVDPGRRWSQEAAAAWAVVSQLGFA